MASRIIIVDDEVEIAEVLEKFLLKQGFETLKFTKAEQAIKAMEEGQKYDLLITDMKMPGMTGIDILRAKNNLKNTASVIILTGSIDIERYQESGTLHEVGCTLDDVCGKPVDLFYLLEMVKRKLKL